MQNYPRRKCVSLLRLDSLLFSVGTNVNGIKIEPNQAIKTTIEYAIIVHLPCPSLLGYEDQQGNEEHRHWKALGISR